MKNSFFALLFLLACTDRKTGKTQTNTSSIKTNQSEAVKAFANPAIVYGSDFITFLATLQVTQPGNSDTLFYYTSAITKAKYSKKAIAKYYATTNLNFKKKLKAIRKLNDSLYLMNFLCNVNATKTLRTFTVSIERDTCRLVIEK